jgi:hypothetical protein
MLLPIAAFKRTLKLHLACERGGKPSAILIDGQREESYQIAVSRLAMVRHR